MRQNVTGVILCGGDSRRMGRDKAAIELSGRTLLERAIDALEPLVGSVLLACGHEPRYEELGRPLVLDEAPDGGPLQGLDAGLRSCTTEWLLALACDMPQVQPATLRGLLAAAVGGRADVILYSGEDGDEPLCALYHTRVRPAVRAALKDGRRRMDAFWDGRLEPERALTILRLPKASRTGSVDPFLNLNLPSDLGRMLDEGSCS